MRRIGVIIAMAVALIASSFMLTSADAHNGGHHGHGLRFVAINDHETDIDVGDAGPSNGDYFVFLDNLYKRHHRPAGELNGQCTLITMTATGGTGQCLVTASLRGGDLTVQGIVRFSESSEGPDSATLAVTGGTGRYAGAGGEVHVRFLSDTKSIVEFDLN